MFILFFIIKHTCIARGMVITVNNIILRNKDDNHHHKYKEHPNGTSLQSLNENCFFMLACQKRHIRHVTLSRLFTASVVTLSQILSLWVTILQQVSNYLIPKLFFLDLWLREHKGTISTQSFDDFHSEPVLLLLLTSRQNAFLAPFPMLSQLVSSLK